MLLWLCFSTDAVVRFTMSQFSGSEEGGSINICVDSGVTEGFEADLLVNFLAMDGKASQSHTHTHTHTHTPNHFI